MSLNSYTWQDWPQVLAFALILHACWPLLFVVLPVVRRRARLRAAHFARAWITGLVILVPEWAAQLALINLGFSSSRGNWGAWYRDPAVWLWISVPLVLLWWWCAVTIGWKVEQGRRIFALLAAASLLAALIAALAADIDVFARYWWMLGYDRP